MWLGWSCNKGRFNGRCNRKGRGGGAKGAEDTGECIDLRRCNRKERGGGAKDAECFYWVNAKVAEDGALGTFCISLRFIQNTRSPYVYVSGKSKPIG